MSAKLIFLKVKTLGVCLGWSDRVNGNATSSCSILLILVFTVAGIFKSTPIVNVCIFKTIKFNVSDPHANCIFSAAIRGRIHQYFVSGAYDNCDAWRDDHYNCSMFRKTKNPDLLVSV